MKRYLAHSAAVFLTLLTAQALSAGVITYFPIPAQNSDAGAGITKKSQFTAAVDAGLANASGRDINGINLAPTPGSGATIEAANIAISTSSGELILKPASPDHIKADGVLKQVLTDAIYNTGAADNSTQDIVIVPETLVAGATYDLRIFFCNGGNAERYVNLSFFGDGQAPAETGYFNADDARTSGGRFQDPDQVYYITYRFTWDGKSVPGVTVTQKTGATPFALYALTNELVAEPQKVAASQPAARAAQSAMASGANLSMASVDAEPEQDQVGVTSETFYNNETLNNNGQWIEVEKYGRCWQPAKVEQGWRPYTRGNFRHSQQAGWTWVSDESEAEWGWATYHYGRWLRLEGVGCEWAWVPGTVWGPAWVSWRSGTEPSCTCVGWAPLPPEIQCKVGVGVNRSVDRTAEIGPDNYTFIEKKNFGRENYHQCGCIVERQRYVDIVRHTRNITNISYVRSSEIYRGARVGITIYNNGPDLDECDAEAVRYGGPRIAQIQINRVADISFFRESRGYRRFDGDVFQVFAPQININARIDRLPNVAMSVSFTKVSRGWEGVRDEKIKKQLKQQFVAETKNLRDNAPATMDAKTKKQVFEQEKSFWDQKKLRDAGYTGSFQGKGQDILKDFQGSGLDARDYVHKNAAKLGTTTATTGANTVPPAPSVPPSVLNKSDVDATTTAEGGTVRVGKGSTEIFMTKDAAKEYQKIQDTFPNASGNNEAAAALRLKVQKGEPLTVDDMRKSYKDYYDGSSLKARGSVIAQSSTLPGATPEPTNAWLNVMKDAKSGSTGDKTGNQTGADPNAPPPPSVPPGLASKDRQDSATTTNTSGTGKSRFGEFNKHHGIPRWLTDAQKTNGWSDEQTQQVLRDYNQKSLKIQDDKNLTDPQKQAAYGELEKKSTDKNAPSLAPKLDNSWWSQQDQQLKSPEQTLPGLADGSTGGASDKTGTGKFGGPPAPLTGTTSTAAKQTGFEVDKSSASGSGASTTTGKTQVPAGSLLPNTASTFNEKLPDLPNPDDQGTSRIGTAISQDANGKTTESENADKSTGRIGTAVSTDVPSDPANPNGGQGGTGSNGQKHRGQHGNLPVGPSGGNQTQIGSAVSTTIPSGTPQIGSAVSIDEKGNVTDIPAGAPVSTGRIGTAVSTDIPSDTGNPNGGQAGSGSNVEQHRRQHDDTSGNAAGSGQTQIGSAVSTDGKGQVTDAKDNGPVAAVTDPAEIAKIQADFQAKFDAQMSDGSGSSTQGAGAANGKTGNATQSSAGNLNNAQGQTGSNQSNQGRGKNRRHPGESFKNSGQSNLNATNGNSTGSSNTGNQSSSNGQTFQNNNSKFGASGDASGGSDNAANTFQGKQNKGMRRPGQHLNAKTSMTQDPSSANSSSATQIGSAVSKNQDGSVTDTPPGGTGDSTGVNRNIKLSKKGKVTELPPTGTQDANQSSNVAGGKHRGKNKGNQGSQVMNQSQVSTSNNSGEELKQQSSVGAVDPNQSGKSQRKLSRKQQRQVDSQGQSQSDTSSVSNNGSGGSRGGKHHKQSQSEPTLKIAPQDTATSTSQSSSSSNGGGGGGGGKKHKQQNNQTQLQQQSQESSSQQAGDGNGGGRGGKKKNRHQQPEAEPTPTP